MKFIPLNAFCYGHTQLYLAISRILAIEVCEDGTWISIDKIGNGFRVQETPEEIFELIRKQEQI